MVKSYEISRGLLSVYLELLLSPPLSSLPLLLLLFFFKSIRISKSFALPPSLWDLEYEVNHLGLLLLFCFVFIGGKKNAA